MLHQERSFFGVLKVENEADRYGGQVYVFRRLIHGTTLHGMQCLNEGREDEPLTYYHITGPIGQVMQVYNKKTSRQNLAVIGLGTGTMASYAHPGQHLTFYDIDPVVRRLSFDEGDPYFTFVDDARKRGARVDLVMGDARLTMERKQLKDSEKYGVIVVDAFSSDAIPIHLMTREALKVYLDKMTERGLLCFHISNRYLDLKPVLYKLAEDHQPSLAAVFQSDNREENYPGKTSSTWVVLARKSEYLDGLRELNKYEDSRKATLRDLLPLMLWPDGGHSPTAPSYMLYGLLSLEVFKHPSRWEELDPEEGWPDLRKVGVWTDDYSNLLSVFSW